MKACYIFSKLRKLSICSSNFNPRILASMHHNNFGARLVRIRKSMAVNCAVSPLYDMRSLEFPANFL
ncbi:hypothetical protein A3728_08605 [Sulfitobacter sp. HI0040]|nr:hypothetical protein A3721_11930 [Sulfitobacter sp. HI0023]KZY23455.1 hypothetical protein A3728_08605 [Sulfitobacter sp. HI0040]KZZ64757.1 hypothetical protein A3764_04200 [Sulfitobacter sp. HI0129]